MEKSFYKTRTGKVFQCLDGAGNPLNYDDYKDLFSRNYVSMLQPGQQLKHSGTGIFLKRLK